MNLALARTKRHKPKLSRPVLIAYMIHPKYSDKGIGMDPKDDEAARVYLVNINQENEAALTLKAYAPQ